MPYFANDATEFGLIWYNRAIYVRRNIPGLRPLVTLRDVMLEAGTVVTLITFSLKDYCNSNEGMRFLANTALLCNAVARFLGSYKAIIMPS